jgi:hypothetical protein
MVARYIGKKRVKLVYKVKLYAVLVSCWFKFSSKIPRLGRYVFNEAEAISRLAKLPAA